MKPDTENRDGVFRRAWEIISRDSSIPPEEKQGILKLIQALVEAAESSPFPKQKENQVKTFTQEIISKHSLMTLVKQQADELDALKSLGMNITSSLNLQNVLDAVVTEAMRLIKNTYAAHIFLYSNKKLEFGASLTIGDVHNKPISMPRPNGITYSVVNSGERIIIEDMANHPLYEGVSLESAGSIISVPLSVNNSIVGVMNLSKSTIGGFTRSELRLIDLLADRAAIAISNASLHKIVMEMANTDSVTGLPNRRALDERLQEELQYAREKGSQFSVVMMDLDGFKAVNDTYGHAVGDDILRSAFNYLANNMRASDFLARYGGDELTLVLRGSSLDEAEFVTHKVIELMKNYNFPIPGNKKMELGLSAGIAIYPTHSRNAGDLLRAADSALYQAKKHNRGSFVVARGITGPLGAVTILRTRSDDKENGDEKG